MIRSYIGSTQECEMVLDSLTYQAGLLDWTRDSIIWNDTILHRFHTRVWNGTRLSHLSDRSFGLGLKSY